MKYDEKFYRSTPGKPSLQMLRSQLERVRQDYERFAGKDTTSSLRVALKQKISELEAEIHQMERARAATAPSSSSPSASPADPEEAEGDGEGDAVGHRGRAAASRRFPPRFRATTAG